MKDISICSYFNFKNKKRISKFRIDLKNRDIKFEWIEVKYIKIFFALKYRTFI